MSQLPPKPDFAALEAAAHRSVNRRTFLMALIGNLVYMWSNNESMFIYILMILMETDEQTAAIVFATLNTTRARVDLAERLAKLKIRDKSIAKTQERIVSRFNELTKMRNEFNHCMYTVDSGGEITHTHSIRMREVDGQIQLGVVREMDEARVTELLGVIQKLTQLNRDIWDFLPRLKSHVEQNASSSRPLQTA